MGGEDGSRRLVETSVWIHYDRGDGHPTALVLRDLIATSDAAATLYGICRRHGVTPRGLVDCMIASVALRTRSRLLAADGDFERRGRVLGLVRCGSL